MVGLGVAAGFLRRKGERGGEGSHYFLAGNTLDLAGHRPGHVRGQHLHRPPREPGRGGLQVSAWSSATSSGWPGFTLILLSLFFAPLYLRSRVPTLPDFLERRFNRRCRDCLAVVSLFSAIVIHIGVALYTAAWVLRGILGLPPGRHHSRHGRADVLHHRAWAC